MKKKILIPCLLFACSLTACDDGLVTKGVAFKDANVTAIDTNVKNEKNNSFKKLKIENKVETVITAKGNGESLKITGETSGTFDIDLVQNTLEISMKANAKSGSTKTEVKGTVKVKKENGNIKTISSTGDASIFKDIDYNDYFTTGIDNCYSWNFEINDDIIEQAASESSISKSTAKNIVDNITENLMVDGDTAKGTFDVGIKKVVPVTIEGTTVNYTKLKYSFKDSLLQSSILGVSASATKSGASATTTITIESNYSYTMK